LILPLTQLLAILLLTAGPQEAQVCNFPERFYEDRSQLLTEEEGIYEDGRHALSEAKATAEHHCQVLFGKDLLSEHFGLRSPSFFLDVQPNQGPSHD